MTAAMTRHGTEARHRADIEAARPNGMGSRAAGMAAGLLASVLAAGLAGFWSGYAVGTQAGAQGDVVRAHVAGACIALEMTAAHGQLTDAARERIVHSLTHALNPYVDRFALTTAGMLRRCNDLRGPAHPFGPAPGSGQRVSRTP